MLISDSLFARTEVRAMRALRKEFIILRRKRIMTACAALLFAVTGHAQDTSIRPFMVNVPEQAFVDLRRRLAATRWPSRETGADRHGIVSHGHGLLEPNHYLSVAISYLFANQPQWPVSVAVGKTS